MTSAESGAMSSRPSKPRRRSALVTASSTDDAITAPLRAFFSAISVDSGHQPPADPPAVLTIGRVLRQDPFFERGPNDETDVGTRQDHDVPRRRMGNQEADVGDQIAGVNGMADERIRPARDDT